MRIRSGFVSNSSSCSFMAIVVKYPIDLLTDDLVDSLDCHGYYVICDAEDGWNDESTMIVGEVISSAEDFMGADKWTMDDLHKIWRDISNKMGIDGENLIVTGTRMC